VDDGDWLPLDWCSFMIGREKDPLNSEVARLILDSIEQDRRRAEAVAAREAVIQPQNQFDNEEGSECVSETEEEHPVWHDSNAVCTPSVK